MHERIEIERKLDKLRDMVTEEQYDEWRKNLDVLESKVLEKQEIVPVVIAHRMLKREFTRLVEEGKKSEIKENEEF